MGGIPITKNTQTMKKVIIIAAICIILQIIIRVVGDIAYDAGRASYAAEAERIEQDSLAKSVESFVDHSELKP